MSQRESGYARKERDLYETPPGPTELLLPHLPPCEAILEPAAASGQMVRVLRRHARVIASDIEPFEGLDGLGDFLARTDAQGCTGIATNPPYELATEFCEHALRLMEPVGGFVAMLLRTDFDHAKSRAHLFRDCPAFSKKLVLMKRIVWFVEDNGRPKASPSFNHAWYLWDWRHEGPATIAYGAA
jgi:hypothetical protein